METAFEIKIIGKELPAKMLIHVKQTTHESLSEIKNKVGNGMPILGCDLCDNKKLSLMIELFEYLQTNGVKVQAFYNGRIEEIEVLKNILESHRQTAIEVGLSKDDIDY